MSITVKGQRRAAERSSGRRPRGRGAPPGARGRRKPALVGPPPGAHDQPLEARRARPRCASARRRGDPCAERRHRPGSSLSGSGVNESQFPLRSRASARYRIMRLTTKSAAAPARDRPRQPRTAPAQALDPRSTPTRRCPRARAGRGSSSAPGSTRATSATSPDAGQLHHGPRRRPAGPGAARRRRRAPRLSQRLPPPRLAAAHRAAGAARRRSAAATTAGPTTPPTAACSASPSTAASPSSTSRRLGLHPVRVETLAGLLFVNLDPAARPLAEVDAGPRPSGSTPYGIPELRAVLAPGGGSNQPANWKIVVENYLEGYHVPIAHPGLMRLLRLQGLHARDARGLGLVRGAPSRGARRQPARAPLPAAHPADAGPWTEDSGVVAVCLRLSEHRDRPLSRPGERLADHSRTA